MRVEPVKQARRRSGIDRRGASGSGSGREQQDIARLAADAIWPDGGRRVHTQERACRGTVTPRDTRPLTAGDGSRARACACACACACTAGRAVTQAVERRLADAVVATERGESMSSRS